jgi:HAMP domain-containing protein
LGVLAAIAISHRITRPLNRLSEAILKVARGDLSQHLEVSRRDEIGELTSTFNQMVIGLQEKSFLEEFSRKLGFTYARDPQEALDIAFSHLSRLSSGADLFLWRSFGHRRQVLA